jgi:hypothetical protein
MTSILEMVKAGGPGLQVLAAAAALAALSLFFLLLALVAGARSSIVRGASMVCLLATTAIACSGAWDGWRGHQAVDESVATLRPGRAEQARREGYLKLRANAARAVTLAGPPLLFCLIGFRAASRRRWAEEHDTPPPGLGIPLLLFLVALVACGADAYLWKGPIPGRDLDETSWRVVDVRDSLDAKDWAACFTLDLTVPAKSPASSLGELKDNQRRCAHHFLSRDPPKAEDLDKLLATPWIDDADVRRSLRDKLEELQKKPAAQDTPATAAAPAPTPAPDPALLEAQSSVNPCLKKRDKKGPKLESDAHLLVTVAANGKVTSVKEIGAGRLPQSVHKCFASALKKVTFAAGTERSLQLPLSAPAP